MTRMTYQTCPLCNDPEVKMLPNHLRYHCPATAGGNGVPAP